MKQDWFQRDWFEAWIDLNLDNLSKYANTLEGPLNSKLKSLKSWIEKEASKITKEEQENFCELYTYNYNQLSRIFPNILRSSLFVMHYAFLENQLVNLCESLHKWLNYRKEFTGTHIQGKGIFKARNYMKKVGNINFPDQKPSWDNIVSYNYIRNFIMHNGGKLDNSKRAEKVKSFMNARPSISLDHLENIQFSKSFCPEVNNTLRSFFHDLFKVLPQLG